MSEQNYVDLNTVNKENFEYMSLYKKTNLNNVQGQDKERKKQRVLVRIRIRGRELTGMLDSGADTTTIDEEAARSMGLETAEEKAVVSLALGQPTEMTVKMARKITIKYGKRETTRDCLVGRLPDPLVYQVLIGMDSCRISRTEGAHRSRSRSRTKATRERTRSRVARSNRDKRKSRERHAKPMGEVRKQNRTHQDAIHRRSSDQTKA